MPTPPYSNVSYTFSNPYDNAYNWFDNGGQPVRTGMFFLNGISLGLNTSLRYDIKANAPGGIYVTWSGPFDLKQDRYALYTNSYLHGITPNKYDIDFYYVNAFPVCFESGEITGAFSTDSEILKSLFKKQQKIASPLDGGTVLPVLNNPSSTFTDIIKLFTDVNTNSYAEEYVLISTLGNYEYLAICKSGLVYLLDFGWETSVGKSFYENIEDRPLTNIAPNARSINIANVGTAEFFSNEKYGWCYLNQTSNASINCYLYSGSDIFGKIVNSYHRLSLSFWLCLRSAGGGDEMVFDSAGQVPGILPETYFNTLRIKLYDVGGSDYYFQIVVESDSSLGSDTFNGANLSSYSIGSDNIFNLQVSIDTNDRIVTTINGQVDIDSTFTNCANRSFVTTDNGRFAIGSSISTSTNDVDFIIKSKYLTVLSFFIWQNISLSEDEMSQNYWVMRSRYPANIV